VKKLILVVLVLVVAAAIGNANAGQAQQQLLPLRIIPGGVLISRVLNWVALNEGIYKKNGLDVDQCVPQNDVSSLKSIAGIDAPMEYRCKPGGAPSPITIAGGMPVSFMSQFEINDAGTVPAKRLILATVQDRTNSPLIARKDIILPEQLRGKRIAFTGTFNILGYQALLFVKAMGWEPGRDVTFVVDSSGTIEGLNSGKFEAFIAGEGLPLWQALQMGYKPLIDLKDWKIPMTSSSVNVDAAWLKDNRETARRLIKSMVDAIATVKHDKRTVFRAMTKYYGITDPKMLDFFYDAWDFPAKPYPDVDGLQNAKVQFAGNPKLRYDDLKNARIEDYIDDSFVRELDQSGYIDSLYKK
jgi:ABC-type nitrate/sulfonate/bicarbonate transport system substrate-binding protein